MIEHLIGLIAPHVCVACTKRGHLLCSPCDKTLASAPAVCFLCYKTSSDIGICGSCKLQGHLSRIAVATKYSGTGLELVHRLKFGRAVAAAPIVASYIFTRCTLPEQAIITHAPTATSRRRQRGYDQAQCIARHLSRLSGLPYAPLLARAGQQRQLGKTRADRLNQQQNSYRLRHSELIQNQTIVLIDDVITTGATLQTSAAALLTGGAANVEAFVFAAALPHI